MLVALGQDDGETERVNIVSRGVGEGQWRKRSGERGVWWVTMVLKTNTITAATERFCERCMHACVCVSKCCCG